MRITPQLNPDNSLKLVAWSFDERELNSLRDVLKESGIKAKGLSTPPDKKGRAAITFTLGKSDVARLETQLGITFQKVGRKTITKFVGEQQGYQCQEITLRGDGRGCVNISATGQNDATVKCAFVAHNKGWFGGTASPGACEMSTRLTRIPSMLKRILRK